MKTGAYVDNGKGSLFLVSDEETPDIITLAFEPEETLLAEGSLTIPAELFYRLAEAAASA